MQIGGWLGGEKQQTPAWSRGRWVRLGAIVSNILCALGLLFLASAIGYGAYSALNTWVMHQNRYLWSDGVAALAVPAMTWTPSPTPTPAPLPTITSTPTPRPSPQPPPPPPPPPSTSADSHPGIGGHSFDHPASARSRPQHRSMDMGYE
jgi:hypothetical protein